MLTCFAVFLYKAILATELIHDPQNKKLFKKKAPPKLKCS